MKFDVSTLKAGQRWRVQYVSESFYKYSFEFTLVKLHDDKSENWYTKGQWLVKDFEQSDHANAKFAYADWWKDQDEDTYVMILLCGNTSHT